MKTTTRKTTKTAGKFDNRTRFNWGFHDAVQVVREGWESKNYGFGPAIKISKPEDVTIYHPDNYYATGWFYGYYQAKGCIEACESSQPAWESAVRKGDVMEVEPRWYAHNDN